MGHQRMADVQFIDAFDSGYRLDVVVMQAMPGIDDQPLTHAKRHAVLDALKLFGKLGWRLGIGITSSMQLDRWGTDTARGLDLPLVGIDEQRHLGTGARQCHL